MMFPLATVHHFSFCYAFIIAVVVSVQLQQWLSSNGQHGSCSIKPTSDKWTLIGHDVIQLPEFIFYFSFAFL